MNKVYPIQKDQIKDIRENLSKTRHSQRNELILITMLNIPLRVSDVVEIKVGNIRNKDKIEVIPKKSIRRDKITGEIIKFKKLDYLINPYLKKMIADYTKVMKDDEYLFQSQVGDNKPLTRQQVWSILKSAAIKSGVKDSFACHSTRKTYARALLDEYGDISLVMRVLGHTSESSTLKYLHLTEEKDNERLSKVQLF